MAPPTRPPPHVLFIHDGLPYDVHIKHLSDAGLRVSTSEKDTAVTNAATLQPDIIVLDFGCDGETTEAIKADPITRHIPVIALLDLQRPF